MLLSVSITKFASGALDKILFESTTMGYTVFIGIELIKMKGQVAGHDVIVLFDSVYVKTEAKNQPI